MNEPQDAGKYQIDNDGTVQGQVVGDHATVHQHFLSTTQPDRVQVQNRQRFLTYLDTRYRDVLEQSLQGAALLALGLRTKPEAIAHLAHLVFRHLNKSERVLPPGTSLAEVYDQAGGDLLVLGEPGAGKSTLLVHLAQGLLTRAERDKEHLLPVIFNLSSWAQKRRSLDEWLVDELLRSYQVPRKVGEPWVQERRILALFDGLDEIAPSARSLCIDALNTYRKDHFVPLVVCSRTTEYFSQEHRLVLQNAVVVQPLTTKQIDDYLETAGSRLVAVRTALQNNQVLCELATSPLMLNVLTLTYQSSSIHALPISGSMEEQQRQIFASYVKRMLHMNETTQGILPQLIWLAKQMQMHSYTIFYIEQMQPSWLENNHLMQAYKRWAVLFPSILIGLFVALAIYVSFFVITFSGIIVCLLLGGLLGAILGRGNISHWGAEQDKKLHSPFWQSLLQWLGIATFLGASIGLRAGLSYGLSFGLCSIFLRALLKTSSSANISATLPQVSRIPPWQWFTRRVEIYNGVLAGLFFWLSFGLAYGLRTGLIDGLKIGLTDGLSGGLGVGLLSALLIERGSEIQPVDQLVWSWRNLGKGLSLKRYRGTTLWHVVLTGLSIGVSVGLSVGARNGLNSGLGFGISFGLGYGLCYWLLFGLLQGVSSETVEDQQRIAPNQGIHRSLSNGLVLGFVSTLIVGLITFLSKWLSLGLSFELNHGLGLGFWLSRELSRGLSAGLVIGPSVGLLIGLFNGGLAYLRHYTLRFLLWRRGLIPWKFPEFLDEAARHILLRKVGGGYVFIHRLFLDYIASLEISSPLPLERSEQQTSHQSVENSDEGHRAT